MNFIFEWQNKSHRVMFFLLYRQKDINKIIDFICQKVIATAQITVQQYDIGYNNLEK